MANKKTNKKLPKCAVNEGEIKPKYGYVHGEADACGGGHLRYRNPKEHKKTWEQTVKPSGHYHTVQHDQEDNEIQTQLNSGHIRTYTAKGHSLQVDGQMDVNGEKTGSHQFGGDYQSQIKGDRYRGTGGKEFKGSAGGVFEHHTGAGAGGGSGSSGGGGLMATYGATSGGMDGDNGGTKYNKVVKGDEVRKNSEGNDHYNVEGDYVRAIKGTKITMIKEGDYATNVQGGNWDTDISKKARMKSGDDMGLITEKNLATSSKEKTSITSGKDMTLKSDAKTDMKSQQDMTIESQSKITIKVGGSSIVIESGSITIKSSQIKFEQG